MLIVLGAVACGSRVSEKAAAEAKTAPVVVAPSATPAPQEFGAELGLDLSAVRDADHREQIARVVESMDRTGAPPEGVVQGGRRGGKKGLFQNAEGRLPRKQQGYWIESDVWPKRGPRDAERLIFGREREVYWTRDHYETFNRLR